MSSKIDEVLRFFKSRPKLTKVIGVIALIAIALFCSMNEKAHALLVGIRQTAQAVSGTEPAPSSNGKTTSSGDDIWGSAAVDYSPTNSSTLPNLSSDYSPTNKTSPTSYIPTTEYSTTNSEQRWLEIRNGYDDGDKAADAERREQDEWLRKTGN